jgi:S-adenosylmethionine:tRNA ribosyltransferase-isomerase
VTLHVGAGTFLPVRSADTADHRMHAEWGSLSGETAKLINQSRSAGKRIVAVGTTALRVLERAGDESGAVSPFSGMIDLFITPGYRFKTVDVLLTNFHLPRSSLFMLVCAFTGTERIRQAYRHAIAHGYRFYSYGDASLLYPAAT